MTCHLARTPDPRVQVRARQPCRSRRAAHRREPLPRGARAPSQARTLGPIQRATVPVRLTGSPPSRRRSSRQSARGRPSRSAPAPARRRSLVAVRSRRASRSRRSRSSAERSSGGADRRDRGVADAIARREAPRGRKRSCGRLPPDTPDRSNSHTWSSRAQPASLPPRTFCAPGR